MHVATLESQDPPWETTGARVQLAVARVQLAVARVQLAVARGWGIAACVILFLLSRKLDDMGRMVSARDVHTEADRRLLRKIARGHQRIADSMSNARNLLADLQPRPFLWYRMMRLFDNVVVQAEDVAETAALGASMEFANLVKKDLKGHSTAKAGG